MFIFRAAEVYSTTVVYIENNNDGDSIPRIPVYGYVLCPAGT